MSYAPVYARQLAALRKEADCRTTDEYMELLEQAVIEMRELYETAPPLQKTGEYQHE